MSRGNKPKIESVQPPVTANVLDTSDKNPDVTQPDMQAAIAADPAVALTAVAAQAADADADADADAATSGNQMVIYPVRSYLDGKEIRQAGGAGYVSPKHEALLLIAKGLATDSDPKA